MAFHTPTPALQARLQYLPLLISVALRVIFLALGTFFACLTARILLWEVHSLADLTTEHLLTIGAVVGAIAAGVFFGPMLRIGKLGSAVGLCAAFLVATGYCLIGSAGRADELAFEKNAIARQVNRDRERSQRDRDEAKRRYDVALDAETAECATGNGEKCKGKRAITESRRSELEVAELLLQKAKPEQRENGKLKRAAQVVALFASTEEKAEKALVTVWPFLPPFICELLTITFLHLGFAPRRRPRVAATVAATVLALPQPREQPIEVQPLTVSNGWTPMSVMEARELARKAKAEDLFQALRAADRPLCNDELAQRIGVNKGECSRRVTALKEAGLLHRRNAGRYVAISLRPLTA